MLVLQDKLLEQPRASAVLPTTRDPEKMFRQSFQARRSLSRSENSRLSQRTPAEQSLDIG